MRLFLAPMEGVVDHHMRRILTQIGGIDMCVTEFIRITSHVLPTRVYHKYCPELPTAPANKGNQNIGALSPVKVQLLGSNADMLAENAVKVCELGASGIDLNFGCPAKTVNKSNGGACLLDHTALLHEIVSSVRNAVPANIPVSAKIRLGYNDRNTYLDNAKAIADAGANELCVHARSKADGYKPPAYWRYIADIKNALTIPVIANGEIWAQADFVACKEQSLCNDFMLGRGLLSKPDLALQIKHHVNGTPYTPMPWHEVQSHVRTFFDVTCDSYPKKHMGNRLKQWLFYLKREYPEAHVLFENIKREKTEETLRAALAVNVS